MNDITTPVMPVAASAVPVSRQEVPEEGSQDWQLLITPGHVRGHRLLHAVGLRATGPALLAGIAGFVLLGAAIIGNPLGLGGVPRSLIAAVGTNPNTYSVIPGYEERMPYPLHWLAGAVGSPQRGLTEESWSKLVLAGSADVRAHGAKTDDYAEVIKLEANPLVTRPQKAFTNENRGRLSTGIIAIPENPSFAEGAVGLVVAWVEGKLALAVVAPAGASMACAIVLGPRVTGCSEIQSAQNAIKFLKPFNQ